MTGLCGVLGAFFVAVSVGAYVSAAETPDTGGRLAYTSRGAMKVQVSIFSDEPLPPGASVVAEIRDTSYADALAVPLAATRTGVPQSGAIQNLATEFHVDLVPEGATVWVHVDADGDGRVSQGDFITMQSYPIAPNFGQQTLRVTVRRVR